MKIYKYIISLVMIAGIMSSCDTDNIGGVYTPTAQNISFESDEAVNIKTSESDIEVSVCLIRNIKQGEYTAHYTLETEEEGVFTDLGNGSVTFADGSTTATVTLKLNGMEKGSEYNATLTLSDADIATADENIGDPTVITSVTVMCDYEWIPAGTATFYDYTFADEDEELSAEVAIENASGTNLYRIIDAYKSIPNLGAEDTGIQFTINSDGSMDMVTDGNGFITTVTLKDSSYIFAWVDDYAGVYCNTYNEGNFYALSTLGIIDGDGYYTGFAFGFVWNK